MSTAPVAATEPGVAPPRRGRVLAVLGLAQLMVVLDTTIVNIALPSAQADLGFSDGSRQWIVTAYALAFAALLLLGGRLADLFGRKPAFLIGAAGFAAASALGGLAPSFTVLVTARALQGVFAALLAPAILSLLNTTFTEPQDAADGTHMDTYLNNLLSETSVRYGKPSGSPTTTSRTRTSRCSRTSSRAGCGRPSTSSRVC